VTGEIFYQYNENVLVRGELVMERYDYIPPPVTEENKAEYFEELSNIKKADEWIKKHSVKEETKGPEIKILKVEKKESHKINLKMKDLIISILLIILFFPIALNISNGLIILIYGISMVTYGSWLNWKYSSVRKKLLSRVDSRQSARDEAIEKYNKIIDPENYLKTSDLLKILLLIISSPVVIFLLMIVMET